MQIATVEVETYILCGLVCHQTHGPKSPYTNTRVSSCSNSVTADKNSRRFVLGKDVVYYVSVAVMYSDELQSECEGMLGAWGVENKP